MWGNLLGASGGLTHLRQGGCAPLELPSTKNICSRSPPSSAAAPVGDRVSAWRTLSGAPAAVPDAHPGVQRLPCPRRSRRRGRRWGPGRPENPLSRYNGPSTTHAYVGGALRRGPHADVGLDAGALQAYNPSRIGPVLQVLRRSSRGLPTSDPPRERLVVRPEQQLAATPPRSISGIKIPFFTYEVGFRMVCLPVTSAVIVAKHLDARPCTARTRVDIAAARRDTPVCSAVYVVHTRDLRRADALSDAHRRCDGGVRPMSRRCSRVRGEVRRCTTRVRAMYSACSDGFSVPATRST